MKLLTLVLGALLMGSTLSGNAFAQSELNGRWVGTPRKVVDSCGFSDSSRTVTHRITAGAASIFLRDENNILTWAAVPHYGKNNSGYYWRSVPSDVLSLGGGTTMLMSYTYQNVRNGRAPIVEQFAQLTFRNGSKCQVLYRGSTTKR